MARNQTVTVRTGGAGIDTRDFRQVAKALRRAAPATALALREDLRAAAQRVAKDAQEIASENSATIPPTVKVRVSSTTVAVVAGGADAPIAGLFELGNTGNRRKSAAASRSGRFRHPVFGNTSRWVNQPMHPFLAPAAQRNMRQVEASVVAALEKATKIIIFDR